MIAEEGPVETETSQSLSLREFVKLPIEARRRTLAEQAEQMAEHYEEESARARTLARGRHCRVLMPHGPGEGFATELDVPLADRLGHFSLRASRRQRGTYQQIK